MIIMEIAAFENGAHRNQTYHGVVPEGWAFSTREPEELEHFPFGEMVVEDVDGVMTVTEWIPGQIPAPAVEVPTQLDRLEAQLAYTAMMTDTLLEV